MEDRALLHRPDEHVFQTHGLGGELEVIVQFLPLGAVLELYGEHRAVGMELDQIGFSDEIEVVAPQWKRSLNTHACLGFVAGRIDQMVHCLSTRRVNIVGERLFQMNQPALSRTIGPVLERGEGNRVCLGHAVSATISSRPFLKELVMAAILKELENQALQLSPQERGELIHRLIASLEGPAEDTPEAVAKAWDEEIARRVAEIDAGTAVLIPHEQVVTEIDEMLKKASN